MNRFLKDPNLNKLLVLGSYIELVQNFEYNEIKSHLIISHFDVKGKKRVTLKIREIIK